MVRSVAFVVILAGGAVFAQAPAASWLDLPLSNWNSPGRAMPQAVMRNKKEPMSETAKRCRFPAVLRSTPGEQAVADAGWRPFHLFDRQILQRDVEIVGGLAGADGMCRPMGFNAFVFVNGRFAGTLSPGEMDSRTDGSVGVVRLAEDDTIAAEFARFTATDALCCPSARVTVRYRIDRNSTPPVVVPVSVRTIRQ
jgi:hypothetical protein